MSNEVVDFERIRYDYESCPDFGEIYSLLKEGFVRERDDYFLQNGFLFRANRLGIPRTSVRDLLIWEAHAGGLSGHFGRNKTIEAI